MSDFAAMGNPEHKCDDACGPYEPIADRDLEDLEESAHIDTLYAELNLVREHVALLLLVLSKVTAPTITLGPRSIAVLLDLSETEAQALLGTDLQRPEAIVNHAIHVSGEDGYMGQAMQAMFRMELMRAAPAPGQDEG
ncbi:hypothetical protein [Streptomyces sp. NPDC015414]|uniref:hypothetical protein n=1 Tax=Streptomyces sp. NPDC015414 TaxID=3364957 RepID=UPI003701E18C